MATTRWRPAAAAVAQVNTITPANVLVTNTFTVTMNGKTVTVTATVATVANVTALLAAALAASTEPEFAEVDWIDSTTCVTGTGATAGVPFTQTSSAAGGTATLTTAAATTATGPNFAGEAKNWSGGASPTTGDTDWLEASDVPLLYGLAQSGVTLAAHNIPASFTADIGLPEWNADGAARYPEYRQQYYAIGATACVVGGGEGQGSQRIKLDNGSVQTALTVRSTGSPAEANVPALLWKGTHASNVVNITAGNVGLAFLGGEVATVATLRVGFRDSVESDARVIGGAGLSLTTLNMSGGQVDLNAGLTTVSKTGGTLTVWDGAVTTLADEDGTTKYNSTGTIGTLTVGTGAKLDFSGDTRPVTVTNCTIRAGGEIYDPKGRVTFTNPIQLSGCDHTEIKVNFGPGRTMAIA